MPNDGNANYREQMKIAQDYVREMNAQRRAEEARQKREKREAQRTAKRESNKRSKDLPWICRFDNFLHDITNQPRNY
jgi:hypothetical protein